MKQQRCVQHYDGIIVLCISQAVAMTEATFKNSKEQLSQEKKNLSNLQRSLAEVSKYLAAFMLFVCAHTHTNMHTHNYIHIP